MSDADSADSLNIKLNLFTRLNLGFPHLQAYLKIREVGNHLRIKGKDEHYYLLAFSKTRTCKHLDRISLERTFI
ncbi:MAG: hypothetical protein KME05_13120 [Gloeocapsa sp. UFS-A4-WI-NPMV-4B04]|nr:hypothetical protein [Gloeocapsa sp. UFS-A4-WI-NPMV-4B04]